MRVPRNRSFSSLSHAIARAALYTEIMPVVRLTKDPPPNLSEFIDEIATGMGALYGAQADAHYRALAAEILPNMIAHPDVVTVLAQRDGEAAGIGVGFVRDDVGYANLIHVLKPHEGRGYEQSIATLLIETLRQANSTGIVCESIPFCALDLAPAFADLGFGRVEREIMARPLEPSVDRSGNSTRAMRAGDEEAVAEVIVDSYRDHPGRDLHPEVRSKAAALTLVWGAAAGQYGEVNPEYIRVAEVGGTIVGALLGCEAAAGVGFVLHVTVHPDHQGQGIGEALVRDALHQFRLGGLSQSALGVSSDNPAKRLYERLGFQTRCAVEAFHWWR